MITNHSRIRGYSLPVGRVPIQFGLLPNKTRTNKNQVEKKQHVSVAPSIPVTIEVTTFLSKSQNQSIPPSLAPNTYLTSNNHTSKNDNPTHPTAAPRSQIPQPKRQQTKPHGRKTRGPTIERKKPRGEKRNTFLHRPSLSSFLKTAEREHPSR